MGAGEIAEVCQGDAAWIAEQSKWARGWRGVVFPTVFLAYLVQVAAALESDSAGAALVAGWVILVAFSACYLAAVLPGFGPSPGRSYPSGRRFSSMLALMSVLFVAELPFAHADALVMGVFVSALTVVRHGERGLLVVVAFTVLAVLLPAAVAPWHDTLSTGLSNGTVIAIPSAGFAMFGFGRVIRANQVLAGTRAELARLAAENERNRIARDLHDLLGHSLTTIAVKAELAVRLTRHDAAAAAAEIAEVGALSRRALGDVRAAIANYREVTLAGELATGRELLRAAGIAAELSPAADVVDGPTQELFGWVVREGLTNVVRHSHARSCAVRVTPSTVEIVDDGVGCERPGGDGQNGRSGGNGLRGLRERVAALGGLLEAGPAEPNGWRLAVRLGA